MDEMLGQEWAFVVGINDDLAGDDTAQRGPQCRGLAAFELVRTATAAFLDQFQDFAAAIFVSRKEHDPEGRKHRFDAAGQLDAQAVARLSLLSRFGGNGDINHGRGGGGSGCSRRGEQLPGGRGVAGFENRKVLLLEVEATPSRLKASSSTKRIVGVELYGFLIMVASCHTGWACTHLALRLFAVNLCTCESATYDPYCK
ncbi:MAG: hypothetical protein IPO15_01500 [Anaerolineae bacterium]|nr:hypothetical protein [Anaerolineae bacterium]